MSELVVLTDAEPRPARIALIGNPNVGKTSLFNALTGLRARTANFPGITVDLRAGAIDLPSRRADLLDLPGLYGLEGLNPEERVAHDVLRGEGVSPVPPDLVVFVADATNLARSLFLAGEVLELDRPTVVALNLADAAQEEGHEIDVDGLAARLGCPVVAVSARTGAGLEELLAAVDRELPVGEAPEIAHRNCTAGCSSCAFADRHAWAADVAGATVRSRERSHEVSRLDRILVNPYAGVVAFLAVMLGVFYLVFAFADLPMTLIDEGFGAVAGFVEGLFPEGLVRGPVWIGGVFAVAMGLFAGGYWLSRVRSGPLSIAVAVLVSGFVASLPVDDFRGLLIDGVIGGVGGVVVFLPQICILFLAIALLEDSGYMARAAFVMERLMRFVGLPGKAFVPMLSSHACAIPGIMATRAIENWRDRLVTILVLPILTCSARLPVYAMVAALLFGSEPAKAALVFVGAYVLGIAAALGSAFVLRRTVLKGEVEPLLLELPPYRRPSLRDALLTVLDRASIFLRKAGTVILLISVVLWGLSTYPKLPEGALPAATAERVAALEAEAAAEEDEDTADEHRAEAEHLVAREELAYSYAGRVGRAAEPIFRPLGFDWRVNVGVISSFAAREVIVSTLAIVYGLGEEAAEEGDGLIETLRSQKHDDGSPVFTTATCVSLLVFYVLAMQCLPTQAVTRRETGSWGWAIFQLVFMTALAYVAAFAAYNLTASLGGDTPPPTAAVSHVDR